MDRICGTLLLLIILQLFFIGTLANSNCCIGRSSDTETVSNCNTDCNVECDCSTENCNSCQGNDRCCHTCCNRRCDCRSVSCNSCSTSSECCSSCCNTKCRSSGCFTSARQCKQCDCNNCVSSKQQSTGCCNSCCKATLENEPISSNISQHTTLPNITIIINHAPIYVNNTPVINTEQRCGNASVLTNGTHIVYVYPQNSSCHNRTCCSRMVRPRCNPVIPPMPPVCPPPVYVSDCSPRCMYAPPSLPPPPPPLQPCLFFQSWPYVHCPQTGCYGFSCAPPSMPMSMPMPMPMPMPVPIPQPAPVYSGCIPLQTWPFIRCIPGLNGDSIVNYGAPSYRINAPGVESPSIAFQSGDYPAYVPSTVYSPGVMPSGHGAVSVTGN